MKNIHVLPTDKPSNGYILGKCIKELSDVKIGQFTKTYYLMFDKEYFQPHNVYITSDEEIKEGDWFIDLDTKYIKIKQSWENSHLDFNGKKIILTTDQDLIKDGVQSIDDEFLEWFVENPSCEFVEVEKEKYILQHLFKPQEYRFRYKINIPKKYKIMIIGDEKESLSKALIDSMKSFSEHKGGIKKGEVNLLNYKIIIPKEEPKQETAEEAAVINYKELYQGEPLTQEVPIDAFIEGAKWQQEKMYSEEEVDTLLEMLKRSIAEINHIKHTYKDRGHCVKYLSDCESAIEQFKNK
jgi:hypothetical protein